MHVYLVCSNQTYGQDCSSVCGKCINGETCHHVSGFCPHGCSEGVQGDKSGRSVLLTSENYC